MQHYRRAAALGANVLVTMASWPAARIAHWTALSTARAIENQAFVVACNRIGTDPTLAYPGASAIVDYSGTTLASANAAECVVQAELDVAGLGLFREKLPFLRDMRLF